MLRTGRLPAPHGGGLPPPRPRGLARRRECCYRGPWRLPGPDSHRLAAVSLSLGYVVLPSFRWSSAPELLDAHPSEITLSWREVCNLSTARSVCGSRPVIVAGTVCPSENSTSTEPPLAAI